MEGVTYVHNRTKDNVRWPGGRSGRQRPAESERTRIVAALCFALPAAGEDGLRRLLDDAAAALAHDGRTRLDRLGGRAANKPCVIRGRRAFFVLPFMPSSCGCVSHRRHGKRQQSRASRAHREAPRPGPMYSTAGWPVPSSGATTTGRLRRGRAARLDAYVSTPRFTLILPACGAGAGHAGGPPPPTAPQMSQTVTRGRPAL